LETKFAMLQVTAGSDVIAPSPVAAPAGYSGFPRVFILPHITAVSIRAHRHQQGRLNAADNKIGLSLSFFSWLRNASHSTFPSTLTFVLCNDT
jgi:hypothetical protein